MVTKSDHSNPLAVTIPYQFTSADDYPTEVLANRFQAWRYIIKDLVSYLREYASVQEEIVRQQIRLQQAVAHRSGPTSSNKEVDISEINRYFLPIGNGSIQDLPTILTKYHQQNVATTNKTLKEITTVIVPKLEELRKDLLMKIKEIKNLQNDFKNNLSKEVNETKNLLNQYYQAVDISSKLEHGSVHHSGDAAESFKYDPYLVKIKLDRQLKKQLQEENYLHQAYENLQESGRKLESIIVIELQNYWGNFLNMLSAEHASFSNFLLPNLNNGFLAKESTFEWDSFIAKNLPSPSISVNAVGNSNSSIKNGTFIDLNFHSRKFSDLTINNYSSPLNMSVREGYLERKSKFLKSYSRGWYVLTCNFIHEFKTSDRKKDQTPVTSISLDNFQVNDHTKNNGKSDNSYKFILSSKPNGIIHRSQTWAFKTDSYENMIGWYNDINNLVSLPNAAARARFLSKRLNLNNTN
ncbi:PH-domain-containing protein, partial [Yamadazyma tenuis ATCC 10573]